MAHSPFSIGASLSLLLMIGFSRARLPRDEEKIKHRSHVSVIGLSDVVGDFVISDAQVRKIQLRYLIVLYRPAPR